MVFHVTVDDCSHSPLTNARRCSQVCRFWRKISLESPTIWANSIDLTSLGQEGDEWRNEVLRRIQNSALTVMGRCLEPEKLGLCKFFVRLLSDHWERIHDLDITFDADRMTNAEELIQALIRPAPNLRAFSLKPVSLLGTNEITFPLETQLFNGVAPSLVDFFVADDTILFGRGQQQLLTTLSASPLRHLALTSFAKFTTAEIIATLSHLPLLESFIVNMWIGPQDIPPPSRVRVSLPKLKLMMVRSVNMAVYSDFLSHIYAHPGCVLTTHTKHIAGSELGAEIAEGLHHVLKRFSNNFLASNINTMRTVTKMTLTFADHLFRLVCDNDPSEDLDTRQKFEFLIHRGILTSGLPLEACADALSSLRYPESIKILDLDSPLSRSGLSSVTVGTLLAKFDLALDSITELSATPQGLMRALARQPQGTIPFPKLTTVIVRQWDLEKGAFLRIKEFLLDRQHVAPVKTLHLITAPYGVLSDLQLFDEFAGLCILWRDMRFCVTT
ncbi:hypothetical protein BDN70DRAFT_994198 [Pholiota conissans]|uniref:F-box domain-containing protein n=1 Tax=Pholiota conissans TaxID=109636 RepID=A0A9P5Z072_9AGAR|nr:hypothetical protein BDN70DRAFT_994198 [Pholiota conissans]